MNIFIHSATRISRVTGAPVKKAAQSKMMSRIKFGSDDEADTTAEKKPEPPKEEETVTVNGDDKENLATPSEDGDAGINRRSSRRCTYFW